jgi:hypothetical protein
MTVRTLAAPCPAAPPAAAPTLLAEDVWLARRAAHEARVDGWVQPAVERARRGERHPVEDFLFTYYSQRPGRLRRWSPGMGVVLTGAAAGALVGRGHWRAAAAGAAGGGAVLAPPGDRVRATAAQTADLLAATASRAARFGCAGLHEWAMVHGAAPDEVRHADWPLRLGAAATSAVVEQLPLQCTHFDAFRFFSDSARPLSAVQLTPGSRREHEQGGCLHANMDLYKHAFRLSPWVPAELVADCFDLARRVRVLDMRASPYDLTSLGLSPVPVETAAGRAEYAAAQRAFAAEAAPLRARLLGAVRALLR